MKCVNQDSAATWRLCPESNETTSQLKQNISWQHEISCVTFDLPVTTNSQCSLTNQKDDRRNSPCSHFYCFAPFVSDPEVIIQADSRRQLASLMSLYIRTKSVSLSDGGEHCTEVVIRFMHRYMSIKHHHNIIFKNVGVTVDKHTGPQMWNCRLKQVKLPLRKLWFQC